MDFFERDFKKILTDLKKKAENIHITGEKCDVRNIFEESNVATIKFNLFIWYFLENGRRSDSSEDNVANGVSAACCYIAMCALPGSRSNLYQTGLYNQCLKIARNCCHTVRIGDTVVPKKTAGQKKKKGGALPNETATEPDTEPDSPIVGPPRIPVDSAERYLHDLTTQFFAFLHSNTFSVDSEILLSTYELIEDLGRIDLDSRTVTRSYRANSVREFRSLERFTDRYSAFLNILIESKYQTRREMAYGKLVRPRLAMMPYPDESSKTSKISTERKRAGELNTNIVLSRIAKNPGAGELKLIETVLVMIYSQCPDLAEFRTNIALFIHKILEALPYQYAYDFVQLMNLMFKVRAGGVKSLSNELANVFITSFDFTAPDPGPVRDLDKKGGEEEAEEVEDEDAAQEENDSDEDSDDERNKSRRRKENQEKEKQKKKKKNRKTASEIKNVDRKEALSILYNIIYMACLDKTAAMRLHGSHSLAKIIDSEMHRTAFQQFCQKRNTEMDHQFGQVGQNLNDTLESMNSSGQAAPANKTNNPTDLLLDEQQIIQKFNKLKMINKGEARVEKDIVYMLVRRLATDDKAPVKKSACVTLKAFLSFCEEEIKFETALSCLQKLCRDKMVSVRKASAEAFTDLMFTGNILFKESLGSKWLHSLISMLNDTDNDVIDHARKLIMRVLTPLLEQPSDLTWTLLDTIESVTNHRQYLMTTLKDSVREKLVKKSVMDSMKSHISSGHEKQNGAWMVFSQLCVQFEQNVDFTIAEFNKVDLSKKSNLVQYMIHVVENNIRKIEPDAHRELVQSLRYTLRDYCLHPSHARSVYHCLGKLEDGIGDKAANTKRFQDLGEELLIKCFDTIVQSFDMFKVKDEWKRNSESQERLLCTALNVATEVFSFSPQLIPRHERLGKTLSHIVNSYDNRSADETTVNPEMPSAHHTRPPTQLSEAAGSSQKSTGGSVLSHKGVLFSDNVRAVGVVTLANMILAHDRLLKLMPMLVKQLQYNPSHQIRSNIVLALGDICASYKTDRYAPMLAASLCDPSVLVRRHAINQIARLISYEIFRFNGEIMIRMMLATLDANEDVRSDAKLYISEVLQSPGNNFFSLNFVQYMIALTQAKRLIGCGHDEDDRGQVDVAIGGGNPLARPSRIAIYTFMIESLDDRSRFDVKMSICQRIFTPIVNGEYDFGEENVQYLLDDALLIMASNEMQVKMDVGKNPNENAIDEPTPEVMEAASGFMQKVYLDHYMKTIVPSILALREFLNQHRSPLQRKCLLAIRMICIEHKNDIDEILQDNRQLKEEMIFELQRVKQRTEEANRILDDFLKKVTVYNKQQKRLSMQSPPPQELELEPVNQEVRDIEMGSPPRDIAAENIEMIDERLRTPQKKNNPLLDDLKTPATALRSRTEEHSTPQSRLLSPKTIKKIRRSVGALIHTEICLNAPNLEDTHVVEEELSTTRGRNRTVEQHKTIVEEPMEQDGSCQNEKAVEKSTIEELPVVMADSDKEVPEVETGKTTEVSVRQVEEQELNHQEEPEDESASESKRSRRRKSSNYDKNDSVDANGKTWKKPKITASKTPEEEVNTSANVTLRRSRRGRTSEADVEKTKVRKRKAAEKDDQEIEQQATPSCSDNAENHHTPRGMTPICFDETKLGGRLCSTPKLDRDEANMTFALDLSAVLEKEEVKNRKSHVNYLQQIFEDDEEEN